MRIPIFEECLVEPCSREPYTTGWYWVVSQYIKTGAQEPLVTFGEVGDTLDLVRAYIPQLLGKRKIRVFFQMLGARIVDHTEDGRLILLQPKGSSVPPSLTPYRHKEVSVCVH